MTTPKVTILLYSILRIHNHHIHHSSLHFLNLFFLFSSLLFLFWCFVSLVLGFSNSPIFVSPFKFVTN
ncbi:hypothetical protein RJT34_23365 [Clitoria ternatea]|uniref:Uncharacterized protein n=1 Tax=Clitoria ternatea TaxID=43366 RepID=A0AAN9FKV5_CLITE